MKKFNFLPKNFILSNNKLLGCSSKLLNLNLNFTFFLNKDRIININKRNFTKTNSTNTNKIPDTDTDINTTDGTNTKYTETKEELNEIKEIFTSLLQNPCSTITPNIRNEKGIYKIENCKHSNHKTPEDTTSKFYVFGKNNVLDKINKDEQEEKLNDPNFLYERLLKGNQLFVSEKTFLNQNYFIDMAKTQTPKFLLIGCSDSRVPPNELTKSNPGEIFIHRNIANQVNPSDLNCMSVIQYAVEYLKIDNIIVMGHTKCGGIVAANNKKYLGLIDQWLTSIKDIAINRKDEFLDCKTEEEFVAKLTEVNVKVQCINVCKTPFVQQAWKEGRNLHVHGWILDIETGLIEDLSISNKDWNDVKNIYNFVF